MRLKNRYEIKETLGRGGMGVVYRASDAVLKCDVAVKTLRDAPDPAALQLFYRECEVLVALNHPNIVPILDIGEYEEEGETRPFFVMPLLPGMTLDRLIRASGSQLTVQRRVEILLQVCRGLHAAHEKGLIHRDIKPGNIFVMRDFSAEIIDFGVAHMINTGATGQKGTLLYMAPEMIEGKPPTALSDIFALGATAFELFTKRRPFERATEREIVEAILRESPPPASDLDPDVNQAISRVLHKSLAKQPWNRFSTARDFADCLEKAHRGEPIEYFDSSRILPRIERAKAAFGKGDHQFAMEIVGELEAEGHLDPDLALLHRQIEIATLQKRIRQLLDGARSRLESEEYPLALQKVQEVLELEPGNADALVLKAKVEGTRSEGQIEGWFRLARQHMDNNAFSHAREALQNVLQMRPQDTRATGLISEVGRREQEYMRSRQEKEQLYQAAVEAFQKGDVSGAMTKVERALEMDRRAPDSSHQERSNAYQNFYNQVRSEQDAIRNSYAEARKHLDDQDFTKALVICEQYLQKYPGLALFQGLKFDVEEQQRLQLSSYIAEIDRRMEAEADLERKVNIVGEALERFPGDPHFERLSRIMRERLDLVSAIIAKARYHEERAQFTEAIGQWEILRTINAKYPGLQLELDRVTKRREQQVRTEAKARWSKQIDAHIEAGDFEPALNDCQNALEEFPGDGELLALQQLAGQGRDRCAEALRLQADGERLFDSGAVDEGLDTLQKAHRLGERVGAIRDSLLSRLVARAQQLVETDWRAAEVPLQQALNLDPSHAGARGVRLLLDDLRREDFLNQSVSQIRQSQADGDIKGALSQLQQALSFYPNESRLIQLRSSLESKAHEAERIQERQRDLAQLRGLAAGTQFVAEAADISLILDLMRETAGKYPGEREFQTVVGEIEARLKAAPAVAEQHTAVKPQGAAAAPPVPPRPPVPVQAKASAAPDLNATMMFASAPAAQTQLPAAGATPPPVLPDPVAPPEAPSIPPPGAKVVKVVKTKPSVTKAPEKRKGPGRALLAGALLLAILATGVWYVRKQKQPEPPPEVAAQPAATDVTTPEVAAPAPEPAPAAVAASVPNAVPRTAATGSVVFEIAPAGAQVTYLKQGEKEPRPVSARQVELEAGEYVVTARAEGYQPISATITVAAGAPQTVNLTLTAVRAAVVHNLDIADWDKFFIKDGAWFTRSGGDFVLYRIRPPSGAFLFSLRPKDASFLHSSPKVRWVLNYSDDKNYILFEIDKEFYTCTEYRDGRKTTRVDKKRHGLTSNTYTVSMTVAPERLTVALIAQNGASTPLDDWMKISSTFTEGRFGFYFPGNDQMWLANFRHTERAR